MPDGFAPRLRFSLMLVWLVATAAFLCGAAATALRVASFPVVVGLVAANGPAAVVATLLPGICGLCGAWLVVKHRRAGPVLLLLYSVFWLVILGGGAIVRLVSQGVGIVERVSWRNWLVGGTIFATMIAAFALMAAWSIKQMRGAPRRGPS